MQRDPPIPNGDPLDGERSLRGLLGHCSDCGLDSLTQYTGRGRTWNESRPPEFFTVQSGTRDPGHINKP